MFKKKKKKVVGEIRGLDNVTDNLKKVQESCYFMFKRRMALQGLLKNTFSRANYFQIQGPFIH